jgi:D-alanine transaminase
MKNLAYYNGEIAPIEELKVPVSDRVCWFGDGVYEAALAKGGAIFTLQEHLDRLYRSAGFIDLLPPVSKTEMAAILNDLVKKVEGETLLVYWQLTRGGALRVHSYDAELKNNFWVTIRPMPLGDTTQKVKQLTAPDNRYLMCNVKTLNLLPNTLAATTAKKAGCYEAVFHRDGRVTEGTHSNIHILKDGVFQTAPADNLILGGITREHTIALCRTFGVPVREAPFTVDEMMSADEVLVGSSTSLCLAASHIDSKPVGGKDEKLLKRLHDALWAEFYA